MEVHGFSPCAAWRRLWLAAVLLCPLAAGANPDLAVTKDANKASAVEGESVIFTVTVENVGTFPASGITINDLTPADMTFVIASFVDGSYNAGTGNWNPPELDINDTATLIFVATVNEGTAGTCITNTATVTAVTPADTNSANDTASAVVCVPLGDVGIFKSVNNPEPAEGNIVEFLIEAEHLGGSPVRNVVIEDVLPAGLTYVYDVVDDPSNALYDSDLGVWAINAIGVSSTATLRIGARVNPGTAGTCITNHAEMTAVETGDVNPANDSDEAVVCPTATPANVADMSLSFPSFPTDAVLGKGVLGGFFGSNNGPSTAKHVRVIIDLPDGFELDEDNAPPYMTQSGGKVIVDIGDIDPFSGFFEFIPLRVRPDAPTGITHITFEVTSDNPDDNMGNNTQTIFIDVLPTPPGGETVDQSGSDGDPVNTYHGELYETQAPDLALGGPLPLLLQRYYASRMQQEGHVIGRLGHNWQHNFDITLQQITSSNITVAFKRGRILFFEQSGTNWNLTGHRPVPFRLLEEPGVAFRLGDPRSHRIYTFNTNGVLQSIDDTRGTVHALTYDGDMLTNVTDGLGRNFTFSYDGDGLLTNVTDGVRSVQYAYVNSNLTTFSDALGNTTTYEYSSDTNFPGLLTRKVRPEGNAPFTQEFDELTRVIAQIDSRSFTSRFHYTANDTFITDPLNFQQRHTHTDLGLLQTIQDEAGRNMQFIYFSFPDDQNRVGRIRDRHTNDWNIFYGNNEHGKVTRLQNPHLNNHRIGYTPRATNGFSFFEVAAITNFDARIERFELDAFGNRVAWTDRVNQVWTYGYNERGQLTGATNPLGGTAHFTYDAFGNPASATDSDTGVWTFDYDALHRLEMITHPNPDTVEFTYDALNRLTSLTDERGNSTLYEYDANSRLTRIEDALGNETLFEYDADDRLVRAVNRLGHATGYGYDPRGLRTSVTNRNGNVTRFQYDATRYLTAVVDPLGQTNLYGRNNEGVLTSFANPLGDKWEYRVDRMGYVTNLITPLGHTSAIHYDLMRRVTNIVNAVGQTTHFQYDGRGGLTNALQPMSIQARYRRNAIGRVDRITDPRGGNWDFTYTPAGRRTSMLDPLSRTNLYEYDTRGRWTRTVFPDGTSVSNALDGAGNVVQREYSAGPVLTYEYDALNRLTNLTGVALTYDAEGRLIGTEQNGVAFESALDPGGRVTEVTYNNGQFSVIYSYDANNRLVSVTDTLSDGGMNFAYDAAGRLTGIARSNGVNAVYEYDANGRRTRIAAGPVGSLIDLRYEYDAQGRITEIDFVNVPLDPAGLVTNHTINLTYDLASQITTANYQCDALGRLTNAPNTAFTWDGASRLIQIDDVAYTYNGLHDLVMRADGVETTRYFYAHTLLRRPMAAEFNETTDELRYYVWSPGGRLLYGIDEVGGAAFYYHFDHAGNTIAITDEAGSVTDSYAYDPYGNLLGRTGTSDQPFEFNGAFGVRREGSLHHMRARWYHARSGRFISKEPIWPVLANARQLNPYQFALQDPLRFVDPEGTDPELAKQLRALGIDGLALVAYAMLKTEYPNDSKPIYVSEQAHLDYMLGRGKFIPEGNAVAYLIARPFNAPEAPDWPIQIPNIDEWYRQPDTARIDLTWDNLARLGEIDDAEIFALPNPLPPLKERIWDFGPGRDSAPESSAPVIAPPQTPPPQPPAKPAYRITLVYSAQASDTPWGTGYYYYPTPGTLPGTPGDFNGDGVVDARDYIEWRKNPGAFGGSEGYDQWRNNFGY